MSGNQPPLERDRLLRVAADLGVPIQIYLEDARESFVTTLRDVDDDSLDLEPVRPIHGNLVLERLLGVVRVEFTVAGLPVSGQARVVSASSKEGVRLSLPPKLLRVQRRRFFRVRAPEGMEVLVHQGDGVRARALVDVSGNGAAFRAHASDVDLVPGAPLEMVQFALGPGRTFIAAATVRQRTSRTSTWSAERLVGVEFEGVSPRDQDRLISWVTERERAGLKERAREPARPIEGAVLLIDGPGNHTRMRAVVELGARTTRVPMYGEDDDLVVGARVESAELRIGGKPIFRVAMTVERIEELDHGTFATLGFEGLGPDERLRLMRSIS